MQNFVRDDHLSPLAHVEFRATKDGGMVIDLNTGNSFGLNRVAAEVWAGLAAGRNLGSIIDSLQEKYSVAREALERDTFRLCAELAAANLLRGPE